MADSKRILVVDDDPAVSSVLAALLKAQGYEVETADDGLQALAQLSLGYDLIVLDVMMPGMDGFEVARRIRGGTECPDIPICMATGLVSREDRLRAVQAGANDFVVKPVDSTELSIRAASLLKIKEAQDALRRQQADLEATVTKRTEDLRKALRETIAAQRHAYKSQLETIDRLALAANYKDHDTAAHIHRMSQYCLLIARKLGLSPRECELILHASSMHDVGKIGIPDAILLKPGKLTPEEWEIMRSHPLIGSRILGGSTSELLQAGELIASSHHEWWNGDGYPHGLAGEAIPLWGRIAAIADVFDALTTERPYKSAYPNEMAVAIMREGRGKQFDPNLLDLFLENIDAIFEIQQMHGETSAA